MRHGFRDVLCAAAIALFQISLILAAGGPGSPRHRWERLHQLDGDWYGAIAEAGYASTNPLTHGDRFRSNVGFFPAYALLGRAVRKATGLPIRESLLVAAQSALFLMWWVLLAWARRCGFSFREKALLVGLNAAFPTSLFLAASYSESLFCLGLVGFLCSERWASAGAFGFVMSAARIAGIPASFSRLAAALIVSRGRITLHPVIAAFLAALGGVSFLAFCAVKFGDWNLYMHMKEFEWGVAAHFLAPFSPATYAFDAGPLLHFWSVPTREFDRLMRTATLLFMALALGLERFFPRASGREFRLSCCLAGIAIFYPSVAGTIDNPWGMSRHCQPVFLVFSMAIFHWAHASENMSRRLKGTLIRAALAALPVLLYFQAVLIRHYARGAWVP